MTRIALIAVLLAALGWLQFGIHFGDDGLRRVNKLSAAIADRRSDNDKLQVENALTRTRIRELKTDPSRLESLARWRLNMIKNGEVLILPTD